MLRRYHRFIGLALLIVLCLAAQGCDGLRATGSSAFEINSTIYAEPGETALFSAGERSPGVFSDPALGPVMLPSRAQFSIPHVYVAPQVTSDGSTRTTEHTIERVTVEERTGDGEDDWVRFSEFDVVTEYATDIGVVIVLDNSASLKGQLGQARRLSTRLAKELLHDKRVASHVQVAIMPLAVQAGREITFSHRLHDAELQALQVQTYAYTPLYDALDQAAMLFDRYEGTRANPRDPFESLFTFEEKFIVVISDGQDDSSDWGTLARVRDKLNEARIKVYALSLQGTDPIHKGLQELARTDWYLDLSAITAEEATERMATVKDTILQSCRDRYNVTYLRSSHGLTAPREIRFILETEPKFSYEEEAEPAP